MKYLWIIFRAANWGVKTVNHSCFGWHFSVYVITKYFGVLKAIIRQSKITYTIWKKLLSRAFYIAIFIVLWVFWEQKLNTNKRQKTEDHNPVLPMFLDVCVINFILRLLKIECIRAFHYKEKFLWLNIGQIFSYSRRTKSRLCFTVIGLELRFGIGYSESQRTLDVSGIEWDNSASFLRGWC